MSIRKRTANNVRNPCYLIAGELNIVTEWANIIRDTFSSYVKIWDYRREQYINESRDNLYLLYRCNKDEEDDWRRMRRLIIGFCTVPDRNNIICFKLMDDFDYECTIQETIRKSTRTREEVEKSKQSVLQKTWAKVVQGSLTR